MGTVSPDFNGVNLVPLTDLLVNNRESELPKPIIKPLKELICDDVKNVMSKQKVIYHNKFPDSNQIRRDFVPQTRFPWGNVDNKVVIHKDLDDEERRILITTYETIYNSFGNKVGNGIDIWLSYDSRNDNNLNKNMTGGGTVVIVRESISDALEVWYAVDGDFKGLGKTGSVGMEGSQNLYTNCKQLILHDKTTGLAVDIQSCLLPTTELRYVPVSVDSPRSMSYFAQGTGEYLQFQNIDNEERFAGVLHEIGHEWLEILDPKPSVEGTKIMNNAIGGISKLEEVEKTRLGELLPEIERSASDIALNKILTKFEQAGMKLQNMRDKTKKVMNKGLKSYEVSLSKALGGVEIKIEHFV